MQIDMHYYGTYAMARAAGISRESAEIIATAAQYVDDNVQTEPVVLTDGARLARTPTAHHLLNIHNIAPDDQRNVWVPFHFLPGGDSDTSTDYGERLKCQKNSEPARQMVDVVVERAAMDPHALERVGVTAHVYADTFSHFGFSGVSSEHNRVDGQSFRFKGLEPQVEELLKGKAKEFSKRYNGGFFTRLWAGIKSWGAETATAALGHGSVATYPDLPYLSWGFEYDYGARVSGDRDNSASFLEACEALYGMFVRVSQQRNTFTDGKVRPFSEIKETVAAILAVKGDSTERSNAWKQAALDGKLFTEAETIPDYQGDAWTTWLENASGTVDSLTALDHPACRFHLAANTHRSWVLHELLPSRNLLIA